MNYKWVEYICTNCGRKTTIRENGGRPQPGKCPRSKTNSPHRWVINRKY